MQKTPLYQLFLCLIILTSLTIVLVFLQVGSIPTCQILWIITVVSPGEKKGGISHGIHVLVSYISLIYMCHICMESPRSQGHFKTNWVQIHLELFSIYNAFSSAV